MSARRIAGLLIALLWLSGCGGPLSDYGQLDERLQAYYAAERAGDWGQVYALRARDFRWTVTQDYFVTAMRSDAAGWELLGYKVRDAVEEHGKVRVAMQFRYRVPAQNADWSRRADAQGIVELEDSTRWVFEDGAWYCEDAGVRRHLPMSGVL